MINQKMKRKEPFLLRVFDRLCYGCAYISAWMMLGIALSIVYEVFVRYFFSNPTKWVNSFTDYTLLYTTFLTSAWLLKKGGHVRLTTFLDRLSPRSRRITEVLNSFIGLIICGVIMWYGAADTWDTIKNSISFPHAIPVPKYYIIVVIPFGSLILLVQFIRDGFKLLFNLNAGAQLE